MAERGAHRPMLCSLVPARKTSQVPATAAAVGQPPPAPITTITTSSSTPCSSSLSTPHHAGVKKEPVISPSSIPTPTTTTLPPPPIMHHHHHQLPTSQALPMSPNMLHRHHHPHHLAAAGLPPVPSAPPLPPTASSLPLVSSQISPIRRNSASSEPTSIPPHHQVTPRKEAPAFVRPFEDSFQPKPPPVAPRNSHTPPVMLTSPAPATLSSSLVKKEAPPPQQGLSMDLVDGCVPQLNHCAHPLEKAVKMEKLEVTSNNNNKLPPSTTTPLCVPSVPHPSPTALQQAASELHPLSSHVESKPKPPLECAATAAVLNVPDKAKVMAAVKESAMASWDYHAISKTLAALRVINTSQSCSLVVL